MKAELCIYELIDPNEPDECQGWRWRMISTGLTVACEIIGSKIYSSYPIARRAALMVAERQGIQIIGTMQDTWHNPDFIV